MRKLIVLGSLVLGVVLGSSTALAKSTTATSMLKPPATVHMMSIAHATGTATISYTKHDADIRLTVDKLPAASALHATEYVLWTVTGNHKIRAGTLKVQADGMGGVHAMTMDTMFSKLVVTAEKTMGTKRPMGTTVLTGAVMHH